MGKFKMILLYIICSLSASNLYSQKITNADAVKIYNKAIYFDKASENDSAIFYYQKLLTIDKELYGEKNPIIGMTYGVIGDFYNKIGNYDLALEYCHKALTLNEELFGETHKNIQDSYTSIAFVYSSKHELDSSLFYFQKALNINLELLGKENPSSAFYYTSIGLLYFLDNKYDSALEYRLEAVKINQNNPNVNPLDIAKSLKSIGDMYYTKGAYNKALEYFNNSITITGDNFGYNHPLIAEVSNNMGECYLAKDDFTYALKYFQLADNIFQKNSKDNSPSLINLNIDLSINMGRCYSKAGDNRLALKHFQEALSIITNIYGERYFKAGTLYGELGVFYIENGDYLLALDMIQKGLSIYKETVGENHLDLVRFYTICGNIYFKLGEYNFAEEYYQKAFSINFEYFGENSLGIAIDYMNIGNCHRMLDDRKLALEYYKKAYFTSIKFIDETPSLFGTVLQNIGNSFLDIDAYDWALKYMQDAIIICKQVFGENSAQVASSYNNMGLIHYGMGNNKTSLDFYLKAVEINRTVFGKKHPELAKNYNNIGTLYFSQGNNSEALKYFQLGLISNLIDFNDKTNYYSSPEIRNYLSYIVLNSSLLGKAQVFKRQLNPRASLTNYQLLNTLIGQMRRNPAKESDKFLMGTTATEVYQKAIQCCYEMSKNTPSDLSKEDLLEKAFYFSESNKAGVLLEALAGQESLRFAGIPDSLLQQEHELKVNTSFYEKKLAEAPDSTNEIIFRDQLFKIDRKYDELITKFEKDYPDYYNLKYATQNPSVTEIQDILDDKTAIRSYFQSDSIIYIFTITKNNIDVQEAAKLNNLNDTITWFRYGLTMTSQRMQENFRRIGFLLYQQLFPENTPIDEQIENLIIIPDGNLAIIPFESLLTDNYNGEIDDYKDYPFLIKKYNISYSYSANLFYRTFSKQKSPSIEITKLNDWLAFAPVFDNSGDQTMVLSTRELQKQLNWLKTDSLMTNRSMFDRSYITPLPATATETESIFKLYDENNLKAKVLLHINANEKFLKSGELDQYKVIHFATHGFVNSERPELSGLLLAQDTTSGEDGVLYSGEIYNLKLNADLVVLSACETGLGKIQKGEGIIGLTRALLYAGAKNIIVSLWQVADASTSDLMVDFYKNSLENKGVLSYSEALRNAKLKMITEGKYAHPLFWSPFILIGE